MDKAQEKVHTIGKGSFVAGNEADEIMANTNRDLGKVSIFVSILSVILLVVLFFGLNQNLTGLTDQVKDLAGVKAQITGMDTRMGDLETKVGALENLPQEARKMVMSTMIMEMAQKTAYLSTQMESEDQAAKLTQAMDLLQQVQTDLIKK